MLTVGNLIYFTPFYFKNGQKPKPKYFIVLYNNKNTTILGSLPTRVDNVPRAANKIFGCINLPEDCFNCFFIPSTIEFTACGFKFPQTTYIYAEQMYEENIKTLESNHKTNGVDYQIIGKVKKEIFNDIIKCFKISNVGKRGYKKLLQQI